MIYNLWLYCDCSLSILHSCCLRTTVGRYEVRQIFECRFIVMLGSFVRSWFIEWVGIRVSASLNREATVVLYICIESIAVFWWIVHVCHQLPVIIPSFVSFQSSGSIMPVVCMGVQHVNPFLPNSSPVSWKSQPSSELTYSHHPNHELVFQAKIASLCSSGSTAISSFRRSSLAFALSFAGSSLVGTFGNTPVSCASIASSSSSTSSSSALDILPARVSDSS